MEHPTGWCNGSSGSADQAEHPTYGNIRSMVNGSRKCGASGTSDPVVHGSSGSAGSSGVSNKWNIWVKW
jgi:hypothetical protein